MFQALRRPLFQDKSVTALPFVEKLKDEEEEKRKRKEWQRVKFKCTNIQALPHDSTDPRFVHDHPNVLLSPAEAHRADGILYLAPDHLVMFGVKMYTSNVPFDRILSQFRATDSNKAYELAEEDEPNEKFTEERLEWDEFGFNKMKALRVHVNIPKAAIILKKNEMCILCWS